MSLVHKITNESVRVSMRVEADGSWRIFFVGGTNEENLEATRLARALLIANDITRGGFVKFGVAGRNVRWLVNEWNCARLYRELHVYPAATVAAA